MTESLSSQNETSKEKHEGHSFKVNLFKSCAKGDFPICLDEALEFIFGMSNEDALITIAEKTKGGKNTESVTSPEGIWLMYKRVMQRLQCESGDRTNKKVSLRKMTLKHCSNCPLYEFEFSRFRELYR